MIFFNRAEFACKCGCGFDSFDFETYLILVDVRQHFGKPVTITSGCRCDWHNGKVNGAKNSKHCQGVAADFKVKDISADDVADYIESKYSDKYGIGRYTGRTHVDSRPTKARWDKR